MGSIPSASEGALGAQSPRQLVGSTVHACGPITQKGRRFAAWTWWRSLSCGSVTGIEQAVPVCLAAIRGHGGRSPRGIQDGFGGSLRRRCIGE